MNIYEKLMFTRCALIDKGIKKTGENKFNKTTFYQLEDFLPHAQKFMLENKLAGFCSIGEKATLKIIDFEKEDCFIEFSLDVKEAKIQGAQAIQNLGGTITYLRRYLWMLALEITESEQIDNQAEDTTKNKTDNKKENETSLKKDRKHYCQSCGATKTEISEGQARDSLEKYNAKLCENCITDKLCIVVGISNILSSIGLNDLLKNCELYLKNTTGTLNNQTMPLIDFLRTSKNYEGAVIAFLKEEIKKMNKSNWTMIETSKNLEDIKDMYILTKED